jgi:hypothetical protein
MGDVVLDVLFCDGLLFLSVRNIGPRPVFEVSVTFDRPVIGLGGTCEISALPLFRHIEFLAPGREIRAFLDSSASYFGRGEPERISARVAYRDERGRRQAFTITHALDIYKTLPYATRTLRTQGGG